MSEAFTVFWDRNSCRELRKAGEEGQPLTVLFGGIHQSCPSLKRAHISHGDVVFPIMVHRGELHVLARAVIKEFISLQSYLSEHLKLPPAEIDGLPEYRVGEVLTRFGITGHRVPHACGIEVALVEHSTPLRFDVVVPSASLEKITFCPRKGPPIGLQHIEDGKLKSSLSLQGNVRRLCEETAAMFSELVGLA
jgi:hypothetical protein